MAAAVLKCVECFIFWNGRMEICVTSIVRQSSSGFCEMALKYRFSVSAANQIKLILFQTN